MAYSDDLRAALLARLGSQRTVFLRDWVKNYTGAWKPSGRPLGLMLHHTAAAATSSTDPAAAGNQRGANNGTINYIQNHYRVPAANFTLDRDGTVYVHAAFPVWHAGEGTFRGKEPWSQLGVPNDSANRYLLGVEVMSKGQTKDFTRAQKESLALLIQACSDCSPDWEPLWLKNRPRHKDWTTRKIDILYTNDEVKAWIDAYTREWDGIVPNYDVLMAGSAGSSVANDDTWRLACRLADLGFFDGSPVRGVQGYPRVAVKNWQAAQGYKATGNYGPKAHEMLFGVKP